MPGLKQRTLDFLREEWGTYIERFDHLPAQEKTKRVRDSGYESFRDVLAHIVAWWETALEIVRETVEGREVPPWELDFDTFNAEAVRKYRSWDETAFLAHFEKIRRETETYLRSMPDEAWGNKRIAVWLRGVIINHAREHVFGLSSFLVADALENEWGEYVARFNRLKPDAQAKFLQKQGFARLRDLLAHIIGWWEEGQRIITGILDDPVFTWQEPDTDAFNAQLVEKFSRWPEADVLQHFENVRLALLDLLADLPEGVFDNRDIEEALASDVVEHFDEHGL